MPIAGTFVRERMFRVGQSMALVVVAPQPWFPLQRLIRRFLPHFRPALAQFEVQQGFEIHRPRFFSVPMFLKSLDGFFMAVAVYPLARRLVREQGLNIIDAHFGFPEGRAAIHLKRWLRLPVVLTLRGKEERQANMSVRGGLMKAVRDADRVICVSDALRSVALSLGSRPESTTVVGNGVDEKKFYRVDRAAARKRWNLPGDVPVLISVGTLVERKGFHRVLEILPELIKQAGDVRFLIVGGAGAEGDITARLKQQVSELRLEESVIFTGAVPPEELRFAYSAADVFVLATSYEGWANVLLEAMSCGLPVVATNVGGNAQVVSSRALGTLVPFGDSAALLDALREAIQRDWDRDEIIEHGLDNGWGRRIDVLVELYREVAIKSRREGTS